MPEFLKDFVSDIPAASPLEITIRLVAALLGGMIVSWIYRATIGSGHRSIVSGNAGSAVSPDRVGDWSHRRQRRAGFQPGWGLVDRSLSNRRA